MDAVKVWKRLSDKKDIDLQHYLRNWIEINPIYKLYIGCDSQNAQGATIFATVIVLHYGSGGGGHVLYLREICPIVKDKFARLWKEVEFSVGAAQTIMDLGFGKPDFIDIDLNPDPKYKSNSVLRSAIGLIESLGIVPRYKTKSPWAISIADSICK